MKISKTPWGAVKVGFRGSDVEENRLYDITDDTGKTVATGVKRCDAPLVALTPMMAKVIALLRRDLNMPGPLPGLAMETMLAAQSAIRELGAVEGLDWRELEAAPMVHYIHKHKGP